MVCRKARYFLVASFDQPLSEADQKELSYHLKDCRACRHESFYYRELFSAEKQVAVRQPGHDFNERLLSEIRLREARSAWPIEAAPRRRFRWPLVYVPALFGAVAAISFFAFLPQSPAPDDSLPPVAVANAPSPSPDVTLDSALSPPIPVTAALRPRYVLMPRHETSRRTGMMFEWPLSDDPSAQAGDPFLSQLVSQTARAQYVHTRPLERYVLPVVSQTIERDRIY